LVEGRDADWVSCGNDPARIDGFVEEDEREEQVKPGDVAVLAGQYMIVGYPEEEDGSDGLYMTAYMKIIRVEKVETRSKRAARRDGQLKSMSTCLFV